MQRSADECKTQLSHVLTDAITMYLLVSISTSVLLSVMQLYLQLIILDTVVMVVSCMVLYYLKLRAHCPLNILALVVRGHEQDLSHAERQQYVEFASFLHDKLVAGLVPTGCMHHSFTSPDLQKVLTGQGVNCVIQARNASAPSVYVCDRFFDPTGRRPRDSQTTTTAEMLPASFAAAQPIDGDARLFWANAIEGTRMPVPDDNASARNYIDFKALHECQFFYSSICERLSADGTTSSLGIILTFLRVCGLTSKTSRYELVMRLLLQCDV